MAQLLAASSSKKRRAGGGPLRILALLPLSSAIRTGALSTPWRGLWERRWPAPSSLDLRLRPGVDPEELLRSLERRGLRRLDRFFLTIERSGSIIEPPFWAPQRFVDYAVACGVEDLHVDVTNHFVCFTSRLTLPPGCPHLARLFIRHKARVSCGLALRSDAFPALEVVHLHLARVDINDLLWGCPRLKTLHLRHCNCEGGLTINLTPAGAHLRSITVVECNGITHIDARRAHCLRSFRFSSAGFPTYDTAATTSLDDLYISLRGLKGQNFNHLGHWIQALPDLANLTVLTICSIALRRFYVLERFGSATCLTKLSYLPSLRELQLIMLEMDQTNLAYMYVFFRCCRCPLLERLFVQLPSKSHDISMDDSLEVAEEEEPDEELCEDDGSNEEEDVPDEEPFEGYEAEEELLLEEPPEENMLMEWLYYKDVYGEDCPEENVQEDEQFEEDVPENEQSEEDVLEDEQSEEDFALYGLNNLVFAKLMKFKGCYCEMRLVSFLLRRASGLQKLLLVPPPPVGMGNYMKAFGEKPLDTSCFLETILNFEKASPDAQIVLDDSDPPATQPQPVHSDVILFATS